MLTTLLRRGGCLAALIGVSAAPLTAQPSVTGTVLGRAGQPIAGADVKLVPVLSNFEAGRLRLAGQRDPGPVAVGRSNSEGRYLLRAPAAGVFKVVVHAKGRIPLQSSHLPLVEDEEMPSVSLAADVGVKVIVKDPAGRPLAGAWVFVASSEKGERSITNAWRPDFRIGQTDGDGSLVLPRFKDERLDVSVFPPGGAEVRRLDLDEELITVTAGGAVAHNLRIVSPGGKPLKDILVRMGDLAWPMGLTDAEGRLRIPQAPGEAATIRLVAPDGRQQTVDLPAAGEGPEALITFADPAVVSGRVMKQETGQPLAAALISPGLDPGAFLFTTADGGYRLTASDSAGFPLQVHAALYLPRATRITSTHLRQGRAPTLALRRSTALRGLVVDAKGVPIAKADVFALPTSGGASGAPLAAALDRVATDSAGRFELRPLSMGSSYEIRTLRPGYLPASIKALAPEASRVAPPLRIVLHPAPTAHGRVLDVSGQPVVGAEVRLSPAERPLSKEPQHTAEESVPSAAHTDTKGYFLVAQIPAERVDLTARKRGYATGHVRGIRIPPGSQPVDLGAITLKPGARLHGRVIDRGRKAVAGAEIFVVDSIDRLEQKNSQLKGETPDAMTGRDGSFALNDLPQTAPMHLLVRALGHLPAGVRDVRPPTPKPLTIRLESAAMLRGRVIDEQGSPVPGARVVLTWQATAPENPERPAGIPIERSDVASRDGRFEISDAPAGSVRLAVTAQGFVSIEGVEATLPWADPTQELTLTLRRGAVLAGRISTTGGDPVSGARISAEAVFEMSDDEGAYTVEGVPLGRTEVRVFHPAYKLVRREVVVQPGTNALDVTFEEGEEVSGRVIDSDGTPVVNARVALVRQVRRDWREYREHSGEDGHFRFSTVARGRYHLEASAESYATTKTKHPVVVEEEPVGGLEVVLHRGAAITGRILGLDAEGLARVEVKARLDDGESFSAFVDAGGRYEIRHLRPGDYLVQASLDSGQRQVQARAPLAAADEEMIRDLQFASRLTLTGHVLYDEEPLADARISIRGSRLAVERSVGTDYQGGFRFDDLEPDTYWLGLSHSRRLLVHNETLELAADREITLSLRPSTVSGTVTDARSKKPVSNAFITLRSAAGPEFLITESAREDGTFGIHRVPPGSYLLTAHAEGHSPAEQTVVVAEGQDASGLELILAPTRGLELTVRLATGRVPERINLRLLSATGAAVLTETRFLDRSGKVTLSTLPEGSWTLLLSAPGGAASAVPVVVPGDPMAITLPGAGHLSIRVPSLAATDFRATATLSAENQLFWTVGSGGILQDHWQLVGGRVIIEDVPAGYWQLRVEASDGRIWTGEAATPGHGETGIALE